MEGIIIDYTTHCVVLFHYEGGNNYEHYRNEKLHRSLQSGVLKEVQHTD